MKIAIVVGRFPVVSETFIVNQVKYFLSRGHKVTVVTLFEGDREQLKSIHFPNRCSLEIRVLSNFSFLSKCILLNKRFSIFFKLLVSSTDSARKALLSLFLGKNGRSLLLSEILDSVSNTIESDVTLAHFGPNGVLAIQMRKLGLITGPVLTVFHGYDIAINEYCRGYDCLFEEGDGFLPISELWGEKLFQLGAPKEKITIHRMGIDLNQFPFRGYCKQLSKSFRFLTVGRLTEKKGIEYSLKAFKILLDSSEADNKPTYRIVGAGELEGPLKLLVQELEIDTHVVFLGAMNPAEVKQELYLADVFVLTSVISSNGDMEGVPVSIMEAMAVGIPVISSYHSGIPELIEHRKNGFLSPERDVKSIFENMVDAIENPELVASVIKRARTTAECFCDIGKNYKALENFIECVITDDLAR